MVTSTDTLEILQNGEITIKGEFLWGSNYTFLVEVSHSMATKNGDSEDSPTIEAVYKPSRGERPLWDFPTASLAKREAAAFWTSQALGWDLVPPTVYRRKAPVGPGSLQLFIKHDPEYHYFNLSEEDLQRLRPTVIFDILINNADRKGSHILFDEINHIWLIDHGVCFHVDDKLRTVVWDFASERFPPALVQDLEKFHSILTSGEGEFLVELSRYLSQSEIKALARRAEHLILQDVFPTPQLDRRPYPWPAI